ncbi:hypothetical protein QR680_004805 [Steinernema hermaphroditum]|uniref:UPAR/Ly6 domain-containing protein n=1 Tax=Steinernema hermaphroditum TaxID=289476 RepID=A0AA39HPW1_9BILA|nr:hypothetical protein QR680_004805 [Steinernema hermaphroditum]
MPSLAPLVLFALFSVSADAIQCYNEQIPLNMTPSKTVDCNTLRSNQNDPVHVACLKVVDFNTMTVTRYCSTDNCVGGPCTNITTNNSPQMHCCCTGDRCNAANSLGAPAVLLGTLLTGLLLRSF